MSRFDRLKRRFNTLKWDLLKKKECLYVAFLSTGGVGDLLVRLNFLKAFRAHCEPSLRIDLYHSAKLISSLYDPKDGYLEGWFNRDDFGRFEDKYDLVFSFHSRYPKPTMIRTRRTSLLAPECFRLYKAYFAHYEANCDFYDLMPRLDGIPLRELTLESLRRQIAIVSQDIILFDDTIRANIAYGSPDASDEAINAAVEAAALSDFVASLPDGLDSRAGENGALLSGGQKQRISIARAFLKNAPILILDEATSALDSESEARIKASLEKLAAGRTCITVAHRFSTIDTADRILAMDRGRIVESGTHDELMVRSGLYAKLRLLQTGSTE